MGLLPPVILGALLIVAFALSAQQRLALNTHTGAMPARQLAYLMRVHHQAAINVKLATPALTGPIGLLYTPPTMFESNYFFLSCADTKNVVTTLTTLDPAIPVQELGLSEVRSIVAELARQTVVGPELGLLGRTPWAVGYNANPAALIAPASGIGISDGTNIHTASGLVPMPPCFTIAGTASIVTQVLP